MIPFQKLTYELARHLIVSGYFYHVLHPLGKTRFLLTHYYEQETAERAFTRTIGPHRFLFDFRKQDHLQRVLGPKNGIEIYSERIGPTGTSYANRYRRAMDKYLADRRIQLAFDGKLSLLLKDAQLYIVASYAGGFLAVKPGELEEPPYLYQVKYISHIGISPESVSRYYLSCQPSDKVQDHFFT